MPEVGDRVKPGRYEMVYEIDHVRQDGSQVDRGEQSEVARARSCPRLDQINSIREAGYDEDYSTFSARDCMLRRQGAAESAIYTAFRLSEFGG